MKNLFFILLLAVIIFSCGKKNDSLATDKDQLAPNSNIQKTEGEGELKFVKKDFRRSVNNCNPSDTCTYFEVKYIEATHGKFRDKFNTFTMREVISGVSYGDTTYPSIEAAADSFLTSYNNFRKEFPESAQFWYYEYTLDIAEETPKIISLASTNSAFMGGAHPNTYVAFLNISKETGDTLTLANLFSPGFEPKLNQLIDKKYREMKSLRPGDNLMNKGDLFENKITFNYNFTPTKEGGITFYYNPYEIAAYVYGPIEVELTREDIAGLLSPSSPLK
jgi:hypothetical protein